MKAVLRLAALSAWSRRLTLGLTLISIVLATTLLLAVERLRVDAQQSFTQSVSGVDLVVGARTGAVQLMLYAVFHSGAASNNIGWKSYQSIAGHPAVEWAVPLSLGDSHRGFAVLGTSAEYFRHFRHGEGEALRFSAGQAFGSVFEAVIGSEVAARLDYAPGQEIRLSHGFSEAGMSEHGDKPFRIVGILAPTGTPVDRTVHVSLEAISALHLDWVGGAPVPGLAIPPQFVAKFDLQPKEITAALVGLKQRSDVFRMQRFINDYRGEPLLAVLPGVALDELWQAIGMVERTLLAISALVVLVGLSGLTATLLAGLNERRRELAILRALGAGPRDLFLMLTAEGLLVTTLGALLGLALTGFGSSLAAPWLLERFGVVLSTRLPGAGELELLVLVIVTGLLASLVPGWRAWRMSLADGLTPRL
ncbi:MAG: ABC transporter permease [Rhodocyclales bacterium]|nr:ABC transporter permease [Rhodocyclales bacterium]